MANFASFASFELQKANRNLWELKIIKCARAPIKLSSFFSSASKSASKTTSLFIQLQLCANQAKPKSRLFRPRIVGAPLFSLLLVSPWHQTTRTEKHKMAAFRRREKQGKCRDRARQNLERNNERERKNSESLIFSLCLTNLLQFVPVHSVSTQWCLKSILLYPKRPLSSSYSSSWPSRRKPAWESLAGRKPASRDKQTAEKEPVWVGVRLQVLSLLFRVWSLEFRVERSQNSLILYLPSSLLLYFFAHCQLYSFSSYSQTKLAKGEARLTQEKRTFPWVGQSGASSSLHIKFYIKFWQIAKTVCNKLSRLSFRASSTIIAYFYSYFRFYFHSYFYLACLAVSSARVSLCRPLVVFVKKYTSK